MKASTFIAGWMMWLLFSSAGMLAARETDSPMKFEERHAGGDEQKLYYLIRHKELPAGTMKLGLLVILPGGPGSADFRPFCTNVLARLAVPEDFLVAELVAPQWRSDENRTVWPGKMFPDPKARFKTENFLAEVIKEVCAGDNVDPRFIFTLGWSSSGHVLYSASVSNPAIRGSLVCMSRFIPGKMGSLAAVRGKNYFLYHATDDTVCPYSDAVLADQMLRKYGAEVKLVSYQGGHGWVPGTFYADRIKEGILWLQERNAGPSSKP